MTPDAAHLHVAQDGDYSAYLCLNGALTCEEGPVLPLDIEDHFSLALFEDIPDNNVIISVFQTKYISICHKAMICFIKW